LNGVSIHEKVFGTVLKESRENVPLFQGDLSRKIDIGKSTLKNIEAGILLPSDKFIISLFQEIGQNFSWKQFQQLVGALQIVRSFRKTNAAASIESIKLFYSQEDPFINYIFELSKFTEIAVAMKQYLAIKHQDDSLNTFSKQTLKLGALEYLPPIYRDMVESTIQDLGQFPPHIDIKSYTAWEDKNSERIIEMHGLISDMSILTCNEGYHWPYLRRGDKSATVNFIILNGDKEKLKEVIKEFETSLKDVSKDIQTKMIHYVLIDDETVRRELKELLYYNFLDRTSYSGNQNTDEKPPGQFKEFKNIWLFSMKSHIKEPGYPGQIIDVAFLDEYSKEEYFFDKVPYYAVSTSFSHTEKISKTLKGLFCTKTGVNQQKLR